MARDILLTEKFKELIETNSIYTDKTNLVKDVLKRKVVLYTRPRRFGKTLNMSMLYYFFSNQEDSYNLFKDLNIAKDEEAMKHLNKYPVILISLKEMTKMNLEEQINKYQDTISEYVTYNSYLLESDKITEAEKRQLIEYRDKCSNKAKLESSLKDISSMLYRHFDSEVIILIDEYDVPLKYAQQYGYYDEMLDFIRSLFSNSLKTNSYLYKGVMTGCLRITKESVFTGLNNFETDSTLTDNDEAYFGFTEDEVKSILNENRILESFNLVKDWYDGYLFGDKEIYNPWSTLKYVKDSNGKINKKPESYWANSSDANFIEKLILDGNETLKENLKSVGEGKDIDVTIYPEMTYKDMEYPERVYSFLLFTGYLKAVKNIKDDIYTVKVPNSEILEVYHKQFDEVIKTVSRVYKNPVLEALENGDENKAGILLNEMLGRIVSYHDNNESFYHGILTGMFFGSDTQSNREQGGGRPDIVIYPSSGLYGTVIVIECKHSKSLDKLESDSLKAVKQIEEKRYIEGIKSKGYKRVLAYGISFYKKNSYITKIASV